MKIVDRDGDFNFVLLLALPPLVGVLILFNDFQRPERLGYGFVLFAAAASVACLFSLWFILREQAREDRFRAWLVEHVAELYQGGASFTPLTVYRNFKGAQPISIAEYMHAMGRRGPQGHA